MADLVMTDEERFSKPFLQWDSESLGNAVKKAALIFEDENGDDTVTLTAGAVLIIDKITSDGRTEGTITLEGASIGEKCLGDWKITLERLDDQA